jgi:hypothetical protein
MNFLGINIEKGHTNPQSRTHKKLKFDPNQHKKYPPWAKWPVFDGYKSFKAHSRVVCTIACVTEHHCSV